MLARLITRPHIALIDDNFNGLQTNRADSTVVHARWG